MSTEFVVKIYDVGYVVTALSGDRAFDRVVPRTSKYVEDAFKFKTLAGAEVVACMTGGRVEEYLS